MVRRGGILALALVACGGGAQPLPSPPAGSGDTDQFQPALATAVDRTGKLWIVAGYTDTSAASESSMGLSLRAPDGTWTSHAPLVPGGRGSFRPSGDAWLAAAQNGSKAYYVSLLQTGAPTEATDDVGDGLALAVVDVGSGSPQVSAPRRIDLGDWPQWDEPTVAATHPRGATVDTVLVAGTPIGPESQDAVAVLFSRDGGASFHEAPLLHAPGYPGHIAHSPSNTLVRPVLQQDPRPGQECHEYLAFGVYYATALTRTSGVAPPACQSEAGGCRSIAEAESSDCGQSWSAPAFIAVDTGSPSGEDYRGFSYAVAGDGTRLVMFGDEDAADAPVLLKRAAPGTSFPVIQSSRWQDASTETLSSGSSAAGRSVIRWRPTLAASSEVAALWVEEDTASHQSALWMRTWASSTPGWTSPRRIDEAGVACDGVAFPSDDYMAAVAQGPFGMPASGFVVAWAPFVPCGSQAPRRVQFDTVH